ncbi:hypothetical protein JTB14_008800 [Gonioctena quinquepunctata]|nr:hypothetical protein JTB14_008800 [Gonioctena quinquepunctata]
MLTYKGYLIPKYLHKRKVEVIRTKIIKRKYAYLFYRKTISKILPSQARNHYHLKLKQHILKRWISYWYKERKEWKLMLRAEIYYNLSLMDKSMQKWKYFIELRKAAKVKTHIAELHYGKNSSRQLLLNVLNKWKWFMAHKAYEKSRQKIANDFFKSKYKPEMLNSYLRRWIIYTNFAKKSRERLLNAANYHEQILLFRAFTAMLIYTNKVKAYRNIMEQAQNLYESKLKSKAFSGLKTYAKERAMEKQNLVLAHTHFAHQLKKHSFAQLKENSIRNCLVRANLQKLESGRNFRMKKRYFERLKMYHQNELIKKEKIGKANAHYEEHLKKSMLKQWKLYVKSSQDEKQKEQEKIQLAVHHDNMNKVERALKIWKEYINYQSKKKLKITEANIFRDQLSLRNFSLWKCFVNGEKQFRETIAKAYQFYQNKKIDEGLLLILKSGLTQKERLLETSKEKLSNQLFLTQKYLSKWKQKTLYKNTHRKGTAKSLEASSENMVGSSDLEWYPICFMAPRIPQLFSNKNM